MKNVIKLTVIAVFLSSLAYGETGFFEGLWNQSKQFYNSEMHRTQSWKAVKWLNGLHSYAPYFPGTWPLNERTKVEDLGGRLESKIRGWGYDIPPFKIPEWCLEDSVVQKVMEGVLERDYQKIHPSVQLGFTVLAKWVPVYWMVRFLYRKATKEKHHHRSGHCHDCND